MTIHVEPTDLVGVEHRTLAFTRYDGTATLDVPGELLTVTQDPTAPHGWCAWYTANRAPDIIPTGYVVAALTPGMPLNQGFQLAKRICPKVATFGQENEAVVTLRWEDVSQEFLQHGAPLFLEGLEDQVNTCFTRRLGSQGQPLLLDGVRDSFQGVRDVLGHVPARAHLAVHPQVHADTRHAAQGSKLAL